MRHRSLLSIVVKMDENGFGEWGGYMEAKITKLEEQFSAASNPYKQTSLFAGISIYVNGLTNPSADELKRIMMVHGGTYHHYERAHTTYIIASNLPDVKVRNMNTSKIISPQWVVDCVREQRILDYTRYLLYTNQKTTQPRLLFKKQDKVEQQLTATNPRNFAAVDTVNKLAAAEQKPPSTNTASAPSGSSGLARTAGDPKFLSEFYNNSRLHHIATLGAGFKQYVGELREQRGQMGFPARMTLKEQLAAQGVAETAAPADACVMHIDMDCFFVSVGLRKYPQLRGQPVAVTHSKGGAAASDVPVHPGADRQVEMQLFAKRFEQHLHNNILSDKVRNGFEAKMSLSEIASCSYEARAKGIKNGMFVGQALKLCPELKTLPYDFEGYREVAYTLYNTVAQYTLNIEAVSCDEMFVDLTAVLDELKVAPMDFVRAIREEVRQKTGCPCSAGVGANKLQARMATKRAKPDGQYQLIADDVQAYMADIPIRELPGVGSSTAYTLSEAKLVTCGDLQQISLLKVQMHVGKKFGETLYQFCRGIDNRPLVYGQVRKSVSAEVNYGIRFAEYAELETFLRQLCAEVHTRLKDIKRRTKCVTLKLMVRSPEAPVEASKFMGHGICDNITKSVSLSEFTCDLDVITRTILTTMKALALPPNELRGIGIQLSKLDDPNEGKERKENVIMNMFSKVAEKRKENLVEIVDTASISSTPTAAEVKEARSTTPLFETKKASPVKTANKRGRGRPAGANVNKEAKKQPNVMGMLQHVAMKRAETHGSIDGVNDNVAANINCVVAPATLPRDIDPEVFAALPADIRAEILRTHGAVRAKIATAPLMPPLFALCVTSAANVSTLNDSDMLPSTSRAAAEKRQRKQQQRQQRRQRSRRQQQQKAALKVDAEFLSALPPELRKEIEMQMAQQQEQLQQLDEDEDEEADSPVKRGPAVIPPPRKPITSDNIFIQPNCTDLLLAWVKSADAPEDYDIELIGKHACELVRAKEIIQLYDPLLYLCRLINCQSGTSDDCAWHLAYGRIISAVQMEMRRFYDGKKLFLGAHLNCDKCLELCS